MNTKKNNGNRNWFLFQRIGYKFSFILGVFLFCASLLSCQTLSYTQSLNLPVLNIHNSGSFSGVVTLYYKNIKRVFISDVFISKKQQIRIDLSLSLGFPVLTLLLDKNKYTLIFLQTKEFYISSQGGVIVSEFFPKDLEFSIFNQIFFDRIPKTSKWICKINRHNLPMKCQYQKWTLWWNRKTSRYVSIRTRNFKFRFQYLSFSPKVDPLLFDISIPKNFKQKFVVK